MANEIDEQEQEQEQLTESGYTNFGGGIESRYGTFFNPSGRMGKWFAKFFATKAQPYITDNPKKVPDIQGDTLVNPEADPQGGMSFSMVRGTHIVPEIELNRKRRYEEYEKMDEYPEIGAAFDIYADDSTQKDIKNKRWLIRSDNDMVVEEVEDLFENIELDRLYWDIVRNTCKYGDCFIELVVDINRNKEGVKRLKVLNPKYILRQENEFGYLTNFLQEIPHRKEWEFHGGSQNSIEKSKFITLDKNQIIHFRLHTSDPLYYPYGKSIAALSHRIFRSLKLMEDAMLIYRLSRAPERRIFYIDVGNLPATKSEMFMERLKQKFKKEKFYNNNTGQIDSRYNPLSADEDFFVPLRGGKGTKIETLPGAQNLGEVDDVKYFRDKLLASLKIPKDYIVEKDKSPERKANLSQLDVKFARTIVRIQNAVEKGFESVAKKHLQMMGYPDSIVKKLKIELPDPSDMFTKRKIEIDTQKTAVVAQVRQLGLFPDKQILKEYYGMDDAEIARLEKEMDKQNKKMAEQQSMMGEGQPAMPGAAPAPPGGPQESMENNPNIPDQEDLENVLTDLKNDILVEDDVSFSKRQALGRIIKKYKDN